VGPAGGHIPGSANVPPLMRPPQPGPLELRSLAPAEPSDALGAAVGGGGGGTKGLAMKLPGLRFVGLQQQVAKRVAAAADRGGGRGEGGGGYRGARGGDQHQQHAGVVGGGGAGTGWGVDSGGRRPMTGMLQAQRERRAAVGEYTPE
jgi:hypothetical protein